MCIRDRYLELFADMKQGKSYYSITSVEGVEKYLAARQKEVELGLITKSRHRTLKIHLKTWIGFISKKERLKDLKRNNCEGYYE